MNDKILDGRAVYYPKYCPECGRKLEGKPDVAEADK